jgi:hypothetical protein
MATVSGSSFDITGLTGDLSGINGTYTKSPGSSVKIENITLPGQAGIWIFQNLPSGNGDIPNNTAVRSGEVYNTLFVELTVPDNNTFENFSNRWVHDNGNYYVAIVPLSNGIYQRNAARIFTNGGSGPFPVTFNTALITLDFGKFDEWQ